LFTVTVVPGLVTVVLVGNGLGCEAVATLWSV
jgi:hypothetical protein